MHIFFTNLKFVSHNILIFTISNNMCLGCLCRDAISVAKCRREWRWIVFRHPKWTMAVIVQKKSITKWHIDLKWWQNVSNSSLSISRNKKKFYLDQKLWEMQTKLVFSYLKCPQMIIVIQKNYIYLKWHDVQTPKSAMVRKTIFLSFGGQIFIWLGSCK